MIEVRDNIDLSLPLCCIGTGWGQLIFFMVRLRHIPGIQYPGESSGRKTCHNCLFMYSMVESDFYCLLNKFAACSVFSEFSSNSCKQPVLTNSKVLTKILLQSCTFYVYYACVLQLNVKEVHLRYEDSELIPSCPFACGVIIKSLSAQSTDGQWVSHRLSRS